jgi:hypothetical protein
MKLPEPICIGCDKHPDQLSCYLSCAEAEDLSPDDYVRKEEGTFNPDNGHFLCDNCYISAGMPTAPGGWIAS